MTGPCGTFLCTSVEGRGLLSRTEPPMERINEILSTTNKRQFLIDCLDRLLKESDFYPVVLDKARALVESHTGDYGDLCARLSEYIYENMPEEARSDFEREIVKFVDEALHPRL